MSKLSKLRLELEIVPGMPVAETISAERGGGNAEAVVRAIARGTGSRCRREFPGEWHEGGGASVIRGWISAYGSSRPVTLKIGASEGLVVKDVSGWCRSMRTGKGSFAIGIGDRLGADQVEHVAQEIAACWMIHGREWTDRSGEIIPHPYGKDCTRAMPAGKRLFETIDGKDEPLTVGELIARGCTRSTHVGEWRGRHSTLIAAFCGMKTILHEFKAEGADDICSFNGMGIGECPKLWGPLCPWNEMGRRSLSAGRWGDIAARAATPFAFHVHATREVIPNAELESSFLLRELGEGRLAGMLEMAASEDPERFYRLVDGEGHTHRLTKADGASLIYGGRIAFERRDVAANVVKTFVELARIGDDPGFVMPRGLRIVPDTHVYIVAEAIAAKSARVFSQSGRDMHRYLTQGGSASMHGIRNERLFRLWKRYGTMESVEFRVYPPIEADSGLVSQYGDLEKFEVKRWLEYKA